MKRLVVVGLAFAALVAPADALAKTPTRAEFNALKRQVSALNQRVFAVEAAKRDLEAELSRVSNAVLCSYAISWDGIFASWYAIDVIIQAFTGQRVFGPQSGVNDQGTCAALGISRAGWSSRLSSLDGIQGYTPPSPHLLARRLG